MRELGWNEHMIEAAVVTPPTAIMRRHLPPRQAATALIAAPWTDRVAACGEIAALSSSSGAAQVDNRPRFSQIAFALARRTAARLRAREHHDGSR